MKQIKPIPTDEELEDIIGLAVFHAWQIIEAGKYPLPIVQINKAIRQTVHLALAEVEKRLEELE